MNEIEVKVSPHGVSMSYYQIHYRPKKKFNWFNSWIQLCVTWNGASLDRFQPVLIASFYDATEYAQSLKNDPTLIVEHNKREDERYKNAKIEHNNRFKARNKSITL